MNGLGDEDQSARSSMFVSTSRLWADTEKRYSGYFTRFPIGMITHHVTGSIHGCLFDCPAYLIASVALFYGVAGTLLRWADYYRRVRCFMSASPLSPHPRGIGRECTLSS